MSGNRQNKHHKHQKRQRYSGEGFRGRLFYFLSRAILNMRQNPFINLVTVVTISLALLIISIFLLLLVNLEGAAHEWTRQVQVSVYLETEPTQQELASLRSRIISMPEVDSVRYIGKDEAFKRFRARLKGQETLLEGVAVDLLPASLEISLKRASRDSDTVESLVGRLKKIPGLGEIQYGEEWVRRLSAFIGMARLVVTLLGGFLLIAVLFIVSNTIKLTVYARRDELELLSLVGATRFFIKAPFIIEGMIQGIAGAATALLLLAGCYYGFLYKAGDFINFSPTSAGLSFLPVEYLGGILLTGLFLGFVGSISSLRRFINF